MKDKQITITMSEYKELECWHKRVEPILDILNGKEYKEEE